MSGPAEEEPMCPLCCEVLDVTDRSFQACPCGYPVCLYCYHHIIDNVNGLCPGCRTPYRSDDVVHKQKEIDPVRVAQMEKEQRERRELASRAATASPENAGPDAASSSIGAAAA